MMNPGTIRWNSVWSKKPLRASETNDALVAGESFTSRRIVKLPQFVAISTSYVFPALSRAVGFAAVRGAPLGVETALQPAALADVVVPELPPPPQPATASSAISGSRRASATAR